MKPAWGGRAGWGGVEEGKGGDVTKELTRSTCHKKQA